MYKFLIKRLLLMIPVLLGISMIIFTIISLTPGNPGKIILGELAEPEAVIAMNNKLGYYDPLPVKYLRYMANLLRGDFGDSYRSRGNVLIDIKLRLPVTLLLTTLITAIVAFTAIPMGVVSAVKKGSLLDNVGTIIALVLLAMPTFWLGLLLMLFFSLYLNLLPATGSDKLVNFILPSITIATCSIAQIMRMTRSSMLEVIRQDYIRTALAKGANDSVIIWRHAIRNALLPVVTTLGNNFGNILGNSIITETVFGMSGIGTFMLNGIRGKDIPVVMGSVMVLAFLFSVVTLIVDLSYGFIDPRIKAQYVRKV